MDVQRSETSPAGPLLRPEPIPLDIFVESLKELTSGIVIKRAVSEFLARSEPARDDLEQYKHWAADHHTRNLIFRNEDVEVMLICWPIGQTTPLHTHNGQLGWMLMIDGKLRVENYRVERCNKPENQEVIGIDCLAGATAIDMKPLGEEIVAPGGAVNTVDKHRTIHRIVNAPEWSERAVSLHIYARPIDSCVVFDMETGRCSRRELKYDY
jgi:cysteine dioxygenase